MAIETQQAQRVKHMLEAYSIYHSSWPVSTGTGPKGFVGLTLRPSRTRNQLVNELASIPDHRMSSNTSLTDKRFCGVLCF